MSNGPNELADVKAALARAKWNNADAALATLLLRHGNLTAEAREWIARLRPLNVAVRASQDQSPPSRLVASSEPYRRRSLFARSELYQRRSSIARSEGVRLGGGSGKLPGDLPMAHS